MQIAIAATFTAEPLEESLEFWMQQLDLSAAIEFAPYNQIFQQLLDPTSAFAQNQQGINVILLRFEDWCRDLPESADITQAIERNLQELITALQNTASRSSTPHILCLCPDSPATQANATWQANCQRWQSMLINELSGFSSLYWVQAEDLAQYPVADYYDAQRDKLGHIPFTLLFYTSLSTAIARRIFAIKTAPYKVIVLDCDNTIWKGVVGEEGVMGIELTPAYRALQEFMIAQQQAGMVLCFCSKNNEPDVIEVFEQRSDMPLRLEHLVAWRINWLPKSENIKSLAQELNLGLDSFIFLDDNPVECAEVRTNCPEVLALQLPVNDDIPKFLQHVWAFDRLKVTDEDKQRTLLYKQNLERERFQQQSLTIDDFLAGLELTIEISEPTADQLPRVAQLTQRTNQFNFSTIRRGDSEIQQLGQAGLDCRVVEVRDRFGDYGLVGVMIFGSDAQALNIDTFLLSCRVLGRGVEHQMLNHLAKVAEERQLATVNANFIPTKKNLPARNFLESFASELKQTTETGDRYVIPVSQAATLSYQPHQAAQTETSESSSKAAAKLAAASTASVLVNKSDRFGKIATQLQSPEQILQALATQRQTNSRELSQPYVAPRTITETELAKLWAELLNLDTVGIQDNYFELGGTSLLSVELFAQIEQRFGKKLPLTALVSAPTVEAMAQVLNQSEAMDSLVLLRAGDEKLPIFLIHDGDGETLLYRNLANRLDTGHPVYGLQPYANADIPLMHTRIPEMAAYYLKKVRSVQPHGPYLLGGMCAGGVIAFEMAQQLQNQGELVAMVALIDAADVDAPKRIGRITEQRLQRFSSVLNTDDQPNPVQKIGAITAKVGQKLANLVVYETQSRFLKLQSQLKLQLFRYYLDQGLTVPKCLQPVSVRRVYEFAERDYQPQGRFQGEVFLVRATQGTGTDEPWIEVYSDPLFGWEQRVTEGVIVQDVPGGHSSMLQEPNVAVMAEKMQRYIDAAIEQIDPPSAEKLPSMIA